MSYYGTKVYPWQILDNIESIHKYVDELATAAMRAPEIKSSHLINIQKLRTLTNDLYIGLMDTHALSYESVHVLCNIWQNTPKFSIHQNEVRSHLDEYLRVHSYNVDIIYNTIAVLTNDKYSKHVEKVVLELQANYDSPGYILNIGIFVNPEIFGFVDSNKWDFQQELETLIVDVPRGSIDTWLHVDVDFNKWTFEVSKSEDGNDRIYYLEDVSTEEHSLVF